MFYKLEVVSEFKIDWIIPTCLNQFASKILPAKEIMFEISMKSKKKRGEILTCRNGRTDGPILENLCIKKTQNISRQSYQIKYDY